MGPPAFGRVGERTQAAMEARPTTKLRAALGDYPHTLPLKTQEIVSPSVTFRFNPVPPVYKVCGARVAERAFVVREMAVVTYLQAKSSGKPLVLLPAVMMGRFQHHCMFYHAVRSKLNHDAMPSHLM